MPLIVSATRIDRHYFDESQLRFFAPGDDADLARAMREAYLDRARNRALAANALRRVEAFAWRDKQAEYLEIVNALSASRVRHAA